MSDGALHRFKDFKNFENWSCHVQNLNVPVKWHLFASAHNREPYDGVGGTVKPLDFGFLTALWIYRIFKICFQNNKKLKIQISLKFKGLDRFSPNFVSHIAQNIAETCQKYFQSFIAIEILPQHFCQLFQNISLQNYNFNFIKYF